MPINHEHGISVLMPVHNGGKYLQAAVDSILNQTHRSLELLLVDDCSSDGAIENLSSDSRLRIVQSPGKGIVPALNEGISKAKYPVIARMDGDDIALANRLEIQLNLLLSSGPTTIVGAQVELFSEKDDIAGGYKRYQNWINQQTQPDAISKNFWVESCVPHPTAMMRRDALVELGGYHNSTWPEDYDLWCRAYLNGFKFIKPENQILLRWRDHPKRTSRVEQRYNKQQFLRCKAHYLSQQLSDNGVHRCAIWGAGPTGAKLHQYLEEYGIQVTGFIDINSKLVGATKCGKPVVVVDSDTDLKQCRVLESTTLVAVSSWGAREEIRSALLDSGFEEAIDFIIVA